MDDNIQIELKESMWWKCEADWNSSR